MQIYALIWPVVALAILQAALPYLITVTGGLVVGYLIGSRHRCTT